MILRNATVRWLSLFLSQLLALILTPLIISHLGKATYGTWLLLVALSFFFSFLDIGFSIGLIRAVSADLAKGDRSHALRVASTCLSLFFIIAVVVLMATAALVVWLPDIFNIAPATVPDARLAMMALGVSIALGFPNRAFEGLLWAKERIDLVGAVEVGSALARFGLVVAVLLGGGGLLGLALAEASVSICSYIASYTLSRRYVPLGSRPGVAFDREVFKDLWIFGRKTLPGNIANYLIQRAPILILGSMAAPSAVAVFGVANRLITNEINLIYMGVGVTGPRFFAMAAQEQTQSMRELLVRSSLYAGLLGAYVALGFLFLGGPFINLWLGQAFQKTVTMMHIMVLPVTFSLSICPCDVLLTSAGRHLYTGLVSICEALLICLLCWLLSVRLGGLGCALAVAIGLLSLKIWLVPTYTCRIVQMPLLQYWTAGPGRAALAGAATALPMWLVFKHWLIATWAELALAFILMSLVYLGFVWVLSLDQAEKSLWKNKLREFKSTFGSKV
ncbi:MAG: oligosaccharide flippase family protein [Desulfarculaceae bacterium]|jgi:O-antigen/teichoic acid export membrane protein